MDSRTRLLCWIAAAVCLSAGYAQPQEPMLAGQDMSIRAERMVVYTDPQQPWRFVMGFDGGVTMTVGDNRVSGREGFLWVKVVGLPDGTIAERYFQAYVYLEGSARVEQGPAAKLTAQRQIVIDNAEAIAGGFIITGQIFSHVAQRSQAPFVSIQNEPSYQRALQGIRTLAFGPDIPASARVPAAPVGVPTDAQLAVESALPSAEQAEGAQETVPGEGGGPITAWKPIVQLASVSEPASSIQKIILPDGQEVILVRGRFYVWHQTREGRMIEFLADNAVLYLEGEAFEIPQQAVGNELGRGQVRAAYFSGNLQMTEGQRQIRADEMYYDFVLHRALIVNASLQTFDQQRGVPIFLRAEKLGRVSRNVFEAQNVQLTHSEFHVPQLSVNASRLALLTNEQSVEQRDSAAAYDGRLEEVSVKYYDFTLFKLPSLRTNFVQVATPLRSVRIGSDSDFGTTIETRWHLARLLGLKELPGIQSQLSVDYFSERGVGGGIEAEYQTQQAQGEVIGYVMTDHGEDDLGRIRARKNLEPDTDPRGRFTFRHRQFFEEGWQLSAETSYLSDRNFLEAMYRDEYYTDKEQETVLYLKRLWDNQAFSVLGKARINDFQQQTEELPTVEYHRIGQSFWDHQLTWYSRQQLGRLRERYDEDSPRRGDGGFYTFGTTRQEVDWPLLLGKYKVVPFAAATYGYDDGQGWQRRLDGTYAPREDQAVLGQFGLRGSTMFWKDDPYVQSSFWNVNGLRHTIMPYAEMAAFEANEDTVDMRDYAHLGVVQRWQTHRGSRAETVDWMRLDVNGTFVSDRAREDISPARQYDPLTNQFVGDSYGPSWFSYDQPAIPLRVRGNNPYYGVVRDALNADYHWRISETTTFLSDANYDLRSGQIQQFDAGFSRLVWPDITYYIGSRYLRPVQVQVDRDDDGVLDVFEKGSHSVIGAISWQLNSRYTLAVAQEYNFDFGTAVRTEVSLVRRYHRIYYALTFAADQTLDRRSVMFSIWPQGVSEVAVGSRRLTGLTEMVREQ